MEDDTTIAAAFRATIQEICSGGADVNILAKAYTGEEDNRAEMNAVKGTALLSYLITNECHMKMEADGLPCTKGNVTSNATAVNSITNLTSEYIISLFFPLDLIPRNSSPKPVLATVRAAFSAVHQQHPEVARRAAKAIVNLTMTNDNLTAEEPIPWAKILLPLPDQVVPLPSSISLEQVGIPTEQLYITPKGRKRAEYIEDHRDDKDIFRICILLPRLVPSTVRETTILLDKNIHMAVAMIQVQSGENVKTLTFSSPPMESNSKAKNHVAHKAVEYVMENHSNTMAIDDDDNDDKPPEKKIQKIEKETTES